MLCSRVVLRHVVADSALCRRGRHHGDGVLAVRSAAGAAPAVRQRQEAEGGPEGGGDAAVGHCRQPAAAATGAPPQRLPAHQQGWVTDVSDAACLKTTRGAIIVMGHSTFDELALVLYPKQR